jgi:hypothetical protein
MGILDKIFGKNEKRKVSMDRDRRVDRVLPELKKHVDLQIENFKETIQFSAAIKKLGGNIKNEKRICISDGSDNVVVYFNGDACYVRR